MNLGVYCFHLGIGIYINGKNHMACVIGESLKKLGLSPEIQKPKHITVVMKEIC